jgi:FkbM family methyltransferase
MGAGRIVDRLHRTLARWPFAVSAALKLRNQLAAIVRYSRASGIQAAQNGEAWLAGLVAPSCSTFIDIGANVGDWTALFLRSMPPGGRGLLFEPSPGALDRLHARFDAVPAVEIVAAAAGADEGTIELYDFGGADEHTSVVPAPGAQPATPLRVPLVTLDRALEQRGWSGADFVKCDAEGYDFRVIEGAARLLREQRIGILQFEYNDSWRLAGCTLGFALRFLAASGYETFLLTDGALRPVEYERFGDYFGYSNYVAISPARMPELRPRVRG